MLFEHSCCYYYKKKKKKERKRIMAGLSLRQIKHLPIGTHDRAPPWAQSNTQRFSNLDFRESGLI